jgi:hypothetical protein
MRQLDHFAGQRHVLFIRQQRAINHHRGKPTLNRPQHMLNRSAVVQMQSKGNRAAQSDITDIAKKRIADKIMFTGVNRDNRRGIGRFRFLHYCTYKAAVRHVECADSKTVLTSRLQ